LCRDIARLQAPLRVVDRDRVRVVLVLRLADKSEAPAGREGLVLQRVCAVRRAGELDDAHAWIVPLHRVPAGGVAEPIAGRAALQPDPKTIRTRGAFGRHSRPARPTA